MCRDPLRSVHSTSRGSGPFSASRDLAGVFAHLRRYGAKPELLVNLLFRAAGGQEPRVAGLFLGVEEAVLVETQAAVDCPLPQHDIVLLAPGEVEQGGRELGVAHHPEVALDAAFRQDAGLGIALGDDPQQPRLAGEPVEHPRGRLRGGHQVNVPDHLPAAAEAPRQAAARHLGKLPERLEQTLPRRQGVAQQMFRGIGPPPLDPFQDVRLRLLPEPRQTRHLARFAGALEVLERVDLQLLVERLDLLGPEAGHLEHRHQSRRRGRLEFLVISQPAGRHQFADLLLERLADPLDFPQPPLGHQLVQRLVQRLHRPRPVQVGPHLEGVLPVQLQQRGDADQHLGNLFFGC